MSVVLFSSVAVSSGQKRRADCPPLDNATLGAWQAGSTERADRLIRAARSLYDDRERSPRVPRTSFAVAGAARRDART